MHAVVSLLDKHHADIVDSLCIELRERFGLRGASRSAHPHFTYHVAEEYDFDGLENDLALICAHSKPFLVNVSGTGIFNGRSRVLFAKLIRDEILDAFQRNLCDTISARTSTAVTHTSPEIWKPHITLARKAPDDAALQPVLAWLETQHIEWKIPVDNLAIIGSGKLRRAFEFK